MLAMVQDKFAVNDFMPSGPQHECMSIGNRLTSGMWAAAGIIKKRDFHNVFNASLVVGCFDCPT